MPRGPRPIGRTRSAKSPRPSNATNAGPQAARSASGLGGGAFAANGAPLTAGWWGPRSEGVWQIDAQGSRLWQRAMAQMLGTTAAEMVGRPLFDFAGRRRPPGRCTQLLRRPPGRQQQRHEFRFVRADGNELWAELSTCPITRPMVNRRCPGDGHHCHRAASSQRGNCAPAMHGCRPWWKTTSSATTRHGADPPSSTNCCNRHARAQER